MVWNVRRLHKAVLGHHHWALSARRAHVIGTRLWDGRVMRWAVRRGEARGEAHVTSRTMASRNLGNLGAWHHARGHHLVGWAWHGGSREDMCWHLGDRKG